MLRLPNCDFCIHYLEDEEKDCCLAYPDGIPVEAMVRAEEGVECANGYCFQEKEMVKETKEPPESGFYKKLLR